MESTILISILAIIAIVLLKKPIWDMFKGKKIDDDFSKEYFDILHNPKYKVKRGRQ